MTDTFTTTTRVGFFQKLGSSFIGIFLGIIFFFAAFGILWWNEGRVNLPQVAEKAIAVNGTVGAIPDKSFVAVTDKVTITQPISDGLYLKPGQYVSLIRIAEEYAWDQESSTKTTKNLGGSETQTTSYTYSKKWVSVPKAPTLFVHPEGHTNPPKAIPDMAVKALAIKIGGYDADVPKLVIDGLTDLNLTQDNVVLSAPTPVAIASGSAHPVLLGNSIFVGKGTPDNPQLGDIRIHYAALAAGTTGTILGEVHGSTLEPHQIGLIQLFRLFPGTAPQAMTTLKKEYTQELWAWRVIGFVVMWIGLLLMAGPLTTALDFIPFLGNAGRSVMAFVTLFIALILSAVAVVAAMIFHTMWVIFVTLALIGMAMWLGRMGRKK